ncbi:MAG TPA: head protein [Hyalangium sp.]|nr:head protein [Hyalangium sp.]
MSTRGPSAHELPLRVMDLLGRIRAEASSAEEQELLAVAIDAMLFITSTGQRYAFMDYLRQSEAAALPPVVASFKTHEEAQSWLQNHPEPPDGTHVLIGDQYHHVVYSREENLRRLIRSPVLEYHLETLMNGGTPAAVASFNTHEEAKAWFESHAGASPQAIILMAGQRSLAVYHHKLGHMALYPVSLAGVPGPKGGQEPSSQQS